VYWEENSSSLCQTIVELLGYKTKKDASTNSGFEPKLLKGKGKVFSGVTVTEMVIGTSKKALGVVSDGRKHLTGFKTYREAPFGLKFVGLVAQ
jgi:hypothetical protein